MKFPCFALRRRWLVALGLILFSPIAWCLFVTVVPTACARQAIVERLGKSSGRRVTLGNLRIGLLGAVYLTDLTIGAPDSINKPWLHLREASIDVSLGQLFFGKVQPTNIDAHGLQLRILRRTDGTLELSDFLQTPIDPSNPNRSSPEPDCPELTLSLSDSSITVIDEPTDTHLDFLSLEGTATCQGRLVTINELRGFLNGGSFQLAAQVDKSNSEPAYEGQLQLKNTPLREGMNALRYLVPVLDGPSSQKLDGKLALDFYLRGQGTSAKAIRKSLVGHGSLVLDPVMMDGSQLITELSKLIELPRQGQVGSVRTDFIVKNGRVATDNLTLDVARLPIVFAGWTDFDGQVDYRLRSELLTDKIPSKARNFLAEMSIDLSPLTDVKVHGTVNSLILNIADVPLNDENGRPHDDRQRLREIGRQLRDRIRR